MKIFRKAVEKKALTVLDSAALTQRRRGALLPFRLPKRVDTSFGSAKRRLHSVFIIYD
jgi:hypothetical protein